MNDPVFVLGGDQAEPLDWQAVADSWRQLLVGRTAVFGQVAAPSENSLALLEGALVQFPEVSILLVVCVYPTCATRADDLRRLEELCERHGGRLEARVRAFPWFSNRPSTLLCLYGGHGHSACLETSKEDLGLDRLPAGKLELTRELSGGEVNRVKSWFDPLWARSARLSAADVLQLPALVLPRAVGDGGELWSAYMRAVKEGSCTLDEPTLDEPTIDEPTIDELTIDELTIDELDEADFEADAECDAEDDFEPKSDESPTDAVGVEGVSAAWVAYEQILSRGSQVEIDRGARIAPVDVPLDPKLLSENPEVKVGRASRRVSMKVRVLDDEDAQRIESYRAAIGPLVRKFSLKSGETNRWMPDTAKPLFETRRAALNAIARKECDELFGGDVDDYLACRLCDIKVDLFELVVDAKLSPPASLEGVVQIVRKQARTRLEPLLSRDLLPPVNLLRVSPQASLEDGSLPWRQARVLLTSIAKYPRLALCGLTENITVDLREDLEAMDVVGDELLVSLRALKQDHCQEHLVAVAKRDLEALKSFEGTDEQACNEILRLLHCPHPAEEHEASVVRLPATSRGTKRLGC